MRKNTNFKQKIKIKNKKKNQKGFTLIELMVVVAIIGVLALLGLRVYAGQQNKAKDAIVKGNVYTVHTLIQSELSDISLSTYQVWSIIDDIIKNSHIHLPAGPSQIENISGMGTSQPNVNGNGGWVFVFVDDATTPTEFYINGVKSDESGFVFENHLKAGK